LAITHARKYNSQKCAKYRGATYMKVCGERKWPIRGALREQTSG